MCWNNEGEQQKKTDSEKTERQRREADFVCSPAFPVFWQEVFSAPQKGSPRIGADYSKTGGLKFLPGCATVKKTESAGYRQQENA
ncbi:UNVERIFIED_ORG: hypothetical protein B5F06_03050 [Lacrimispora saccharolytica]|nr:hypothetical protein CLOM621_05321 [Clostridium sp. M62/1]